MKQSEIKTGETYFFIATDSKVRQHLINTEFTVTEIKNVWRRQHKKSRLVKRFYNEFGEAARAEELEPLNVAHIQESDYKEADELPF